MQIDIQKVSPFEPQVRQLLQESHALMTSLFPPDSCHFLDLDALNASHIHLFCAFGDDMALGTGAIAIKPFGAEIKSMFTAQIARKQGIADAILQHLVTLARSMNLHDMYLETGTGLDAAHRLYERHGFERCEPFGTYAEHCYSIFMHRSL